VAVPAAAATLPNDTPPGIAPLPFLKRGGHGGKACARLSLGGTAGWAPGFAWMKEILSHQFAVFLQPGALVAMFLMLVALGLGDAAIAIAARGWPF